MEDVFGGSRRCPGQREDVVDLVIDFFSETTGVSVSAEVLESVSAFWRDSFGGAKAVERGLSYVEPAFDA